MREVARESFSPIKLRPDDTLKINLEERTFAGFLKRKVATITVPIDKPRTVDTMVVFDSDEFLDIKDPYITVIGEKA